MSEFLATAGTRRCDGCGTELGRKQLACPGCGRLAHAARLAELAAGAQAAAQAGEPSRALALWREALDLLPPGSRQHTRVLEEVASLSRIVDTLPGARPAPKAKRSRFKALWAAPLAAVAFLLGKGKLLLLGLTKWSTLATMFLTFGAYWTAFGWKFAAGLIASIYVHEMGHVAAMRHFGIPASAPMFIPGVGAFVRLKQAPIDSREDARIGLAGPIWGLGVALVCWAIGRYLHSPIWMAIATTGAWINIFNLIPVWQLDGARGLRVLSSAQRWLVVLAAGLGVLLTMDGLVILLLAVLAWRALQKKNAGPGDTRACVEYCVLLVALSLLIHKPPVSG